jgi:TolB-like protein
MPRLQLKLLGGFDARIAPGEPLEIATRKTRALLAYLALPTGRPHSRDKLTGLLWSNRADPQARNSLRQAVSELGRALGSSDSAVLVKDRDRIALASGSVEVDAAAFEKLAGSEVVEDLRHASAMYVGDLLEGLAIRDAAFEEWLLVERQRLRDLAVSVFKKLLVRESGGQAMGAAKRLLALDPLQEDGYRALMRFHCEAGEIGAALRQYETCCELLKRELGVTPSAETEGLHRQIRDQPSRLADPAGASAPRGLSPSIAVLPFRNIGGDPEEQYLSDGIAEDILTALSRYHELFVIARNSSFQFRDKAVDVRRIGQAIGVAYLIDGTLRKSGNRLRITAHLIEVATGIHLWADRYDRELEDVFAVQDEVAQTIAATLVGQVERSHASRTRRSPPPSWIAYDYVLQGREHVYRYELDAAKTLLTRAIELDPNYGYAFAVLSWAYLGEYFHDLRDETLRMTFAYAQKALSLDDNEASCHSAMGLALMFMGHLDAAGTHFDKSVSLNSNSVAFATARANWLGRVGRASEALAILDIVALRDPLLPPFFHEVRSGLLFCLKRYEEVIQSTLQKNPKQFWDPAIMAASYAYLGNMKEARAQAAEVLRMKPDFSIKVYAKQEPFKDSADLEHLLDGFRKAGLAE